MILLLEAGLVQAESYTGDGSVDFHGKPVLKHSTGNWKACPFIYGIIFIGTECCERLAYFGIAGNLVAYFTKKTASRKCISCEKCKGTCFLTPLIGALFANAYWGKYWTIPIFSTIYLIGVCTLTLSASVPGLKPAECVDSSAPPPQYAVFLIGLDLTALGTGSIKPCISSFGADQFHDTDPKERAKTFFSWFYFSINISALMSSSLIVWLEDNAGWSLGFVIPAFFVGLGIGSFLSGTAFYRFQRLGGSPVTRMCQILVASLHKWNLKVLKRVVSCMK